MLEGVVRRGGALYVATFATCLNKNMSVGFHRELAIAEDGAIREAIEHVFSPAGALLDDKAVADVGRDLFEPWGEAASGVIEVEEFKVPRHLAADDPKTSRAGKVRLNLSVGHNPFGKGFPRTGGTLIRSSRNDAQTRVCVGRSGSCELVGCLLSVHLDSPFLNGLS